jgi:primosomal protein N' (replication factor Y) (superfamily II helicase)
VERASEQGTLALPGLRKKGRVARGAPLPTASRSTAVPFPAVARVLLDLPWAHLDREFDYGIPVTLLDAVKPGVRVRARFAGKLVDGWVIAISSTETAGHYNLRPLHKVVSPEPILTPEIVDLVSALAQRYAGTRADLLRLAVPPRHARAEREVATPEEPWVLPAQDSMWGNGGISDAGRSLLRALTNGESPRCAWTTPAAVPWPQFLASACLATLLGARSALVVLPSQRDVQRLHEALRCLGITQHLILSSQLSASDRYRSFLRVLRSPRALVIGTRSAAFAPVNNLGLCAVWDDGDDLHAEPRAPYPHAREVVLTRAHQQGAGVLLAGHTLSVEAFRLTQLGWLTPVAATPRAALTVRATGADPHQVARGSWTHQVRMPPELFSTIRRGLAAGPVLVQTPRRGYQPALACQRCREAALCEWCESALRRESATEVPTCLACGRAPNNWRCQQCGATEWRSVVVGELRTAEELGRAFPGVSVRTSGGNRVLYRVEPSPSIVVATPGAEPIVTTGYSAVVMLDASLMLSRRDMRVAEEAARRWFNVLGLARSGGEALIVGHSGDSVVQALIRKDPQGLAARELAARESAGLPPTEKVATITGSPGAVDDAKTLLRLPEAAEIYGPSPIGNEERLVIKMPRDAAATLSAALLEFQGLRAARKLEPVRVQVDPISL